LAKHERQSLLGTGNSFFPNPATEYINIGVLTQFAFSITIFDQSGRIILKKENVLGNSTLDIRNFENGVYLVKMEGQGFCNVKKLVKVSD
jgi:hypothetical protein